VKKERSNGTDNDVVGKSFKQKYPNPRKKTKKNTPAGRFQALPFSLLFHGGGGGKTRKRGVRIEKNPTMSTRNEKKP